VKENGTAMKTVFCRATR